VLFFCPDARLKSKYGLKKIIQMKKTDKLKAIDANLNAYFRMRIPVKIAPF
jgi:hypothetical protein